MSIIVTPLHAYYSPARLERVIGAMQQLGSPRIWACLDLATGAWLAQEGTHRLCAAVELGVVPVIVAVPWRRGQKALERARHAAARRGHLFPRVEVV